MDSIKSARECAVKFVAQEKAELVTIEADRSPLKPDEIFTHTLVSLISSGTEVAGGYSATHYQITASSYPMRTGYASISQVEEVGSEVVGLAKGDLVLGGCHQSFQRDKAERFVKVPTGLAPEVAVFSRMAKISMPSFVRTAIRPPEILVVTGLGLVGMLAAQIGQSLGYQTIACDPSEKRRKIAQRHGLRQVIANVPVNDPLYAKKIGFGLDCSGHEQAVLDLCNSVRVWGEVAIVGVPWIPRTSLLAQKVLHSVFYNYVDLKSGWEGQMPTAPHIHSEQKEHATAMQWLEEGRIKIDPSTYRKVSPSNPQEQYQELLHNQLDELTFMFDWRQI